MGFGKHEVSYAIDVLERTISTKYIFDVSKKGGKDF